MTRQLAFDLPGRVALGRENFFVSPANALAVAALDGWRDWPERRMLLFGPEGAGKTHLAHVWVARNRGGTAGRRTGLAARSAAAGRGGRGGGRGCRTGWPGRLRQRPRCSTCTT